jgi:hypothetical protein
MLAISSRIRFASAAFSNRRSRLTSSLLLGSDSAEAGTGCTILIVVGG